MTADDIALVRQFIYSLTDPDAAFSILDLGCGKGVELVELASRIPASARLSGLDVSDTSIEAARQATADDPRVSLAVYDVTHELPFDRGSFDRVLSVNLLECIPDKHSLLKEVHRVLTPGGKVVFAHWDWDSVLVDGDDKGLVRKIVHAFADWKQKWMADADGWMGRRLWRTFQQSGLFSGRVHPFVYMSTRFEPGTYGFEHIKSFGALVRRGLVSQEELDAFTAAIERLAAHDQYCFSLTMYVYVGQPL